MRAGRMKNTRYVETSENVFAVLEAHAAMVGWRFCPWLVPIGASLYVFHGVPFLIVSAW